MSDAENLILFCRRTRAHFVNASTSYPVIQISHSLGNPPDPAAKDALYLAIPISVPELLKFYENANGARLFENSDDPEEAFCIVPIENLEGEKAGVYAWLTLTEPEDPSEWGEDVGADGSLSIYGPPDWWDSAIVFGHFGYSPESFAVATEGKHSGRVFQLDHEISALDLVFETVGELFAKIVHDPVGFIRDHYGVAYMDIVSFESEQA